MTTTTTPQPGSFQAIWNHCVNVVTQHYADFDGTVTRREFWTFYLATVIVEVAALIIFSPVGIILILGLFVPTIAIGTRRLHETGQSGWWQLIQLIPIVGIVVIIVMLAQPAKVTSVTPGTIQGSVERCP
jgi:uncharacterized membrane protein YhaH (DUF805 family)